MTPSRLALGVLLVAAALTPAGSPVLHAADRVLGQPRILDNGDIQLSDDVRLGRRQGGKTILQPDSLQIQGPGSTGPIDGMTVGGTALSGVLGTKAPLASPTFTGPVTAPSLSITGTGSTGPIDGMTVGGRSLADRAADVAGLAVTAIPGMSTSTATVTCTVFQAGSGFVLCPPGSYDFAVGHGVLVPGQGAAYPGYSAVTGVGGTVMKAAGSTTRCYVLVGLDGVQGYGSPSAQGCVANAPAVPSSAGFVKVSWTNGPNPPPTYALYQGPSGGPYKLVDFLDNSGAGAAQFGYDYSRPAPRAEFWLPSTITAGQASVRQAGHGVVSAVRTDNYLDLGFGLAGPAGASVTLYHDNALPLRYTIASAPVGVSLRIPVGTYPVSSTNFSGSTISLSGKRLVGADRSGTVLSMMNSMIAAPFLAIDGVRPEVSNLTLDFAGYSASAVGIAQVYAATRPAFLDLTLKDVPKNAIGNNGSTDLLIRHVTATSAPDYANQSTFLHSVRGVNSQLIENDLVGFGFDMNDNVCTIRGNTVRNFFSAAAGTEIDTSGFGRNCEISYNLFEPSPDQTPDINETPTECVETWQPGDHIHDNICIGAIGSAWSVGGQNSRLINNTTSRPPSIVNNAPAMTLRFDSPTNWATGSIVSGNTVLGGYNIGLGSSGASSGRKCLGCTIGPNALTSAPTPIAFDQLSGAEIFTSPTPVTFSQLPAYHAVATRGRRMFCTDCLKPGQSANNGTGIEVTDDGSAWVRADGSVATR